MKFSSATTAVPVPATTYTLEEMLKRDGLYHPEGMPNARIVVLRHHHNDRVLLYRSSSADILCTFKPASWGNYKFCEVHEVLTLTFDNGTNR